ncbi:MAG: O-antigen ligase domain-containing protein [Nitrospirae bacterium]|nr:MAG: O-antigen ligase domain-containing protein [Nitrospirota bacterium]
MLCIDRAIMFCLSLLILVLPIARTITVRSIAIGAAFILLIARIIVSKKHGFVKTSLELPLAAFATAAIVSFFSSIDVGQSLKEFWREFITPVIVLCTVYLSIQNKKSALILCCTLLFGSLIFSLYSFFDFYRHDGTWLHMTYKAGGLRDPGGGEAAGLYHTLVIPFIFWGLFYTKERGYRFALIMLLILNAAALYITFTRASYLALAAEAFVALFLLLSQNRFGKRLAIALVILLLSAVLPVMLTFKGMNIPTINEFITMSPEEIVVKYAEEERTGAGHRLAMWKTALEKISEDPLHPHGYGRFLFGRVVRNEGNKDFIYSQVHNTFIGMAFELGLQGFLVFLWMILSFAFFFLKKLRQPFQDKDSLPRYFSAAMLTMMSGYWVNNFFGSFDAGDSKLLFMLLLGIGAALTHRLPLLGEENAS